MFVNNVTINGVSLLVAFVRTTENGLSVNGMTHDGLACVWDFTFADGLNLTVSNDSAVVPEPEVEEEAVPAKKERKARKPKAEKSEVVEVEIEELDYDAYKALKSRRGRRSEAQKAALAQAEFNHSEWAE